jgi:hypothetical protein
MTENTDILLDRLRSVGLQIDLFDPKIDPELFGKNPLMVGMVSGGPLQAISRALMRVGHETCNVSSWIPFPKLQDTGMALELAEKLLLLSFSVPFGRISLSQFSYPGAKQEQIRLVFAETMFFWKAVANCPAPFTEEVTLRLRGLDSLYASTCELVRKYQPGASV